MTVATKITYTSTSGDLEQFHLRFDAALARVRENSGQLHPFYIDGRAIESSEEPLEDRSPIDGGLLARFAAATAAHVEQAIRARRSWCSARIERR